MDSVGVRCRLAGCVLIGLLVCGLIDEKRLYVLSGLPGQVESERKLEAALVGIGD